MFAVPLWSPDKYGDGIRYRRSKDRRLWSRDSVKMKSGDEMMDIGHVAMVTGE